MFKGLFDLLVGFAAVLDVPPSWWILYEPKKPQALTEIFLHISYYHLFFLSFIIEIWKNIIQLDNLRKWQVSH